MKNKAHIYSNYFLKKKPSLFVISCITAAPNVVIVVVTTQATFTSFSLWHSVCSVRKYLDTLAFFGICGVNITSIHNPNHNLFTIKITFTLHVSQSNLSPTLQTKRTPSEPVSTYSAFPMAGFLHFIHVTHHHVDPGLVSRDTQFLVPSGHQSDNPNNNQTFRLYCYPIKKNVTICFHTYMVASMEQPWPALCWW